MSGSNLPKFFTGKCSFSGGMGKGGMAQRKNAELAETAGLRLRLCYELVITATGEFLKNAVARYVNTRKDSDPHPWHESLS
jgi:hypothetical protein